MGLHLTDEQRNFVSNNHNLIYKFAHKNNISLEDYYDALAIGLCKAAAAFDEDKGMFSTLAFRCMQNEFNCCKRSERSKKAIPADATVSYDVSGRYRDYVFECVEDRKLYEGMIANIETKEFVDTLSTVDKKIIEFLSEGMTRSEIGGIIGTTQQNVSYRIKHIKKNLSAFYNS